MTKTSAFGLVAAALPLAVLASCRMSYDEIARDKLVTAPGGAGGATSASSSSTGGPLCTPGATQSCYDGPAGTQGVGTCKAGTQTCAASGTSWGACMGEVLPLPSDDCSGVDQNCDGVVSPCAGMPLFSAGYGDTANQGGYSVAADASGNILVAGYFSGTLDFGTGALMSTGTTVDAFVVKLAPSGSPLWSKRFGGPGNQLATAVTVDASGNVIVAGNFTGSADFGGGTVQSGGGADVFVVKLDPSGAYLWSRQFGANGDQLAGGVGTDASGNILITGPFSGSVSFGGSTFNAVGVTDLYVAKLAPASGAPVWSKSFGSAGGITDNHGVAVDGSGNVLLTGSFSGSVDLGGGLLTSATGNLGMYVAKLSSGGAYVWAKAFGVMGNQTPKGIATDATGAALVTGSFTGSVDFGSGALVSAGGQDIFIAKLAAGGGYVWANHFGDASDQVAMSVATDSLGNVLLAGGFAGSVNFGSGAGTNLTSAGGQDIFVAKLGGSDGHHLWSKSFGDAQDQSAAGVAADSSDDMLVTGGFHGTVNFGGGPLMSMGGADVFVAKLGP